MDADAKTTDQPKLSKAPAPALGPGLWDSRFWLLPLALVALGHGWLTAGLFGSARGWDALGDDRPIVAGRHALHLYHGHLGARAFVERQQACTYDPCFNAGYPKTPWFDGGSKPAELFLATVGGEYRPAAYKWGLGCCVALVPLILAMAAWSAGLNHGGTFLTALLGATIFWSDFGRSRLWAGDLDVLFASCLAVLTCAQLLAYHEKPGLGTWLGLVLALALLCFIQPLVLLALAPAFLLYYFGGGGEHRLMWHLGLAWAVMLAAAANWPWLQAAARSWWIQADAPTGEVPAAMSLQSLLDAVEHSPLFHDALHRGLAIAVLVASVLGLLALKHTLAPRTLGAAMVSCLGLALFGEGWEPLERFDPSRLFFAGLLLGTLPAVQGIVWGFGFMSRLTGSGLRGAGICITLLMGLGVGLHQHLICLGERCVRSEALPLGLSPEVQKSLQVLNRTTTAEARILWEETRETDVWSPLLPLLTERCYIGGLGNGALIEHAAVHLGQGQLAGRPLADWTDADLADFSRRYNLGWVVSRTPAATARFQGAAIVSASALLPDGGTLHTLRRPHSWFVLGQGKIAHCDGRALTLADVTPVDGHVVLSFHYHPGIVASTDRVRVEKEPQLYDAIPFIRLRVPGPMSRLTLYWRE